MTTQETTLTVLRLNTPFTYLVQSAKNKNYKGANEYVVNTHKKSCSCPYGTHHADTVAATPCKHLEFCVKIEREAMIKNMVHLHLAIKGIRIEKVLKVTRIVKCGKATQIVSASYITVTGKRASCFVNTSKMIKERYFEIYENTKNVDGSRTLRVSINEKVTNGLRHNLGSQFDLIFDRGVYTKHTYGDVGCYKGIGSVDIYQAMTSVVIPTATGLESYMEYLRITRAYNAKAPIGDTERSTYLNSYFQHNGINLYYLKGFDTDLTMKNMRRDATKMITFETAADVKAYKEQEKTKYDFDPKVALANNEDTGF